MSTEIPYPFAHLLPVLIKSLWSLIFYCFLYVFFFSHEYKPRQGQTTHWGQKFYDNRKTFSLCPYVASFKMISSKSDFIYISNDFILVYSTGARAENPLGTNFWCQQKALITSTICCKFHVFPHLYSPGAGADNPLWTKFWCQQKGLVTLPICCKSQKIKIELRWSWYRTCENYKVNKVEKWQKITAGLNPNHMHIFKPWKKRCAKMHKDRHEIV